MEASYADCHAVTSSSDFAAGSVVQSDCALAICAGGELVPALRHLEEDAAGRHVAGLLRGVLVVGPGARRERGRPRHESEGERADASPRHGPTSSERSR